METHPFGASNASGPASAEFAELAPTPIWATAPDGGLIYANAALREWVAAPLSALLGDGWLDWVHADDQTACRDALRQAMSGQTQFALELRLRRHEGQHRWVALQARPCYTSSGVYQGHVGVWQDITRDRAAQSTLLQRDRWLQALVDHSPVGICQIDTQGRLVFANDRWSEICGYSKDELLGQFWNTPIHPDDWAQIEATWNARRPGERLAIECRCLTRGGDVVWVLAMAVELCDADGTLTGFLGTIADIGPQRQAEQAKRQLAAIIDATPDAVFMFSLEGRCTYANRAARQMLSDADPAQSGQLTLADVYPRAQLAQLVERAIPEALVHGAWRGETLFRGVDGAESAYSQVVIPLPSERGAVEAVAAIARDISPLKQAELRQREAYQQLSELRDLTEWQNHLLELRNAELEAARQLADAANRAKSEFLANMSHEIRTPMTAVLGYAELLLSEGDLGRAPPNRLQMLDAIRRNGQHLLQLINDVLDLSKIEAGKLEVERARCSPAQVVADAVELMRVKAQSKALELTLEFDGPLPATIETDPHRLQQILLNLIGNAIKFTASGGVSLHVSLQPSGSTPPSAAHQLQIVIADTGIGISPDRLERLFMPFTQADASTTRRFGGTGLGLVISQRLANALGGQIGVESEAGRGSRFTVSIATGSLAGVALLDRPTAPSPPPADAQPAADAQPLASAALPPCRVLLAEDGLDNQRLISLILSKRGADVTVVENGAAAVEQALAAAEQGQPFDVILMDMLMPVMDGYEATRTLRQADYRAPIIALTANAMSDDRKKCLQAGCDDYLSKPIDRARLFAALSAAVRGSAAARDAAAVGKEPWAASPAPDVETARS